MAAQSKSSCGNRGDNNDECVDYVGPSALAGCSLVGGIGPQKGSTCIGSIRDKANSLAGGG